MKNRLINFCFICVILLGICIPAHAGWVQVDKDDGTVLISKGKFKSTWEDGWSIFDTAKGEMTMGNSKLQIYARGTVDDYCKAVKTTREGIMKNLPQEQMAIMEQMMKDMTPEQRNMMKQMMEKGNDESMQPDYMPRDKAPKVSVIKVGSGEVIAGFNTVKYNVMVNGRLYKEIWLTTDSSLLKEMGTHRKKAILLGQKFEKCMGINEGVESHKPEHSSEYIELELKGWMLREIEEGDVKTDVIKLEKKSIPPTEFQPPTKYKRVSISEMFEMEMGKE